MKMRMGCCCPDEEPPDPPCRSVLITIRNCDNTLYPGIDVKLKRTSDDVTVSSGTTNSSGQISLGYFSSESHYFTYEVPADGRYAIHESVPFLLLCGTPPTGKTGFIGVAAEGWVFACCQSFGGSACTVPIPKVLHVDDGMGEVELTWSAAPVGWFGCALRNSSRYWEVGCGVDGQHDEAGDVAVSFKLECSGDQFFLTISVFICSPPRPTTYPVAYTCPAGAGTGTTSAGIASAGAACDPFSWSATVPFAVGQAIRFVYGASTSANVYV